MMLVLGVLTAACTFVRAEGRGDPLAGWTIDPTPSPAPYLNALLDVHANSAADVWAVGVYGPSTTQALAIHWDGSAWTQSPLAAVTGLHSLNGVHGTAADNVWAVGWSLDGGVRSTLIMRFDGESWSIIPSPSPDPVRNELRAVAALSSTDVWAVGYQGVWDAGGESPLAMHWDGESWQVVPTPADPDAQVEGLSDVSAFAPDEVWAVGDSGVPDAYDFRVMRYDGTSWQDVDVPQSGDYGRTGNGIVALAPDNVWVAGFATFKGEGDQPVILHFDGEQWHETLPFCQYVCYLWDIAAVAGAAGGGDDLLATGDREIGGPDFPQAYRSEGVDGEPWTWIDLEEIDGSGTGHTRGCAVLSSGEAWVVGWRTRTSFVQETRVYHYIPPDAPILGDLDGDGSVGFSDLLILLASWGACPAPPRVCPADLDGSGDVGFNDLLILLSSWS